MNKENAAKVQLIEKMRRESGIDLDKTNYSDKLNLFFRKAGDAENCGRIVTCE